jgi:hypothetical protein
VLTGGILAAIPHVGGGARSSCMTGRCLTHILS